MRLTLEALRLVHLCRRLQELQWVDDASRKAISRRLLLLWFFSVHAGQEDSEVSDHPSMPDLVDLPSEEEEAYWVLDTIPFHVFATMSALLMLQPSETEELD